MGSSRCSADRGRHQVENPPWRRKLDLLSPAALDHVSSALLLRPQSTCRCNCAFCVMDGKANTLACQAVLRSYGLQIPTLTFTYTLRPKYESLICKSWFLNLTKSPNNLSQSRKTLPSCPLLMRALRLSRTSTTRNRELRAMCGF